MITSLLQIVAGLMQVDCQDFLSTSLIYIQAFANIKLYILIFTDLIKLNVVNRFETTCTKSVAFMAVYLSVLIFERKENRSM